MNTQDYTTTIIVDASPEQAFKATNNVRGWWSECIQGTTDKINSIFSHRDEYLYVTFKITQMSMNKIVWDVVKSHNNMFMDNLHEWDNTRIVFEISENAKKTQIKFTHEGLTPKIECHEVCSNAWNRFITISLKNFIETGKGDPISNDYESFNTSITVDKSPEEVYKSVNNVRGWWSEDIEGTTKDLGSKFFYHHKDVHLTKFKIVEMVPNEKVVWFVTDNFFNFVDDKTEWKYTTVLFEISKKGDKTELVFTHQGLIPIRECYKACEDGWRKFIDQSLYDLITKGKGQPLSEKNEEYDTEFVKKWKEKN